jgi:hypothetical protein
VYDLKTRLAENRSPEPTEITFQCLANTVPPAPAVEVAHQPTRFHRRALRDTVRRAAEPASHRMSLVTGVADMVFCVAVASGEHI